MTTSPDGRPHRGVDLAVVAAAAAAVVAMALPAAAQRAIDGDTIELKGATYRLHGIDAAEPAQVCADGWPAGYAARAYLTELIGERTVTCMPIVGDQDDGKDAICRADGVDLGAAMVTGGHAMAFVPFSARYISQEDAAIAARRGLHAHKCMPPWEWRARAEKHG